MFRKFPTVLYYFTRLHSMSSTTKNTDDILLLATYGTLRDDDDSGAPWAANFLKGMSGAVSGKVHGYRLFGHLINIYPFAIFTGDSNDSIVVRLVSWPTKEEFEQKIRDGDILEGDAYERKVVEVHVEGGKKLAYIYVLKTKSLGEDWKPIPSGDWLKRHSK